MSQNSGTWSNYFVFVENPLKFAKLNGRPCLLLSWTTKLLWTIIEPLDKAYSLFVVLFT